MSRHLHHARPLEMFFSQYVDTGVTSYFMIQVGGLPLSRSADTRKNGKKTNKQTNKQPTHHEVLPLWQCNVFWICSLPSMPWPSWKTSDSAPLETSIRFRIDEKLTGWPISGETFWMVGFAKKISSAFLDILFDLRFQDPNKRIK